MNDLRIPIGGFFTLVGAILAVTGVASGGRARLESANINLYYGVALLVFGCVMLWLARHRS
ncbi:MAG TPA: hypothetical protein VMB25_16370 [Bryobacteraceae bacterium]|nr:hypothetical protein [Bryobacteraceae bacterium]